MTTFYKRILITNRYKKQKFLLKTEVDDLKRNDKSKNHEIKI